MNLNDPAINHLAVARAALLEPYGLDEAHLAQAIGTIFEHKVDYADLYFQYTRSEGWSLEEGIVKSGNFDIDSEFSYDTIEPSEPTDDTPSETGPTEEAPAIE